MRIRRTLVISLVLVLWIVLTYVTITNRQTVVENVIDTEYRHQLQKLEQEIVKQHQVKDDLIRKIHNVIESKKFTQTSASRAAVEKNISFRKFKGVVIPVLVFACNRVSISRCLDQLIQHRPNPDQFPIIVSQDCNHQETTDVIRRYGDQVVLIQQPDQSDIQVAPKEKKFKGYFKIARHYGWALNQTFFNFNFQAVIVLEDDLDIASDFFEYFLGTYPLLVNDPSLWCISAWNDNGKPGLIDEQKPELLYRTDFFPGLGWMLTKSLWLELCNKWPKSYWDDWMRRPEQRKQRSCIRPEISRTRTFGKIGVSNGLFFDKHLKYIKLNEKFVPFSKIDLNYLFKDVYDSEFIRTVYQSAVVSYQELKNDKVTYDGAVRIIYHTKDSYKRTAKLLGLMDDTKSGVPRTSYKGIVSFHYKTRPVYLAPNMNWKGYDLSWS